MCISLNRVIAGLASAAVIFSAVQSTNAQGLTIRGGFHGGFGGFHRGFPVGGHFERFHGQNFGRGLNGGIFGAGIFDSYGYGPYGGIDPPGYGYSISAASTGASSAYSGGLTGNYEAPGGDCVLYKLNYDGKGNYRSVTATHPCR